MKWTSASVESAKRVLQRSTSLDFALSEIQKTISVGVTLDSLASAFRRHKLKSPSNYLLIPVELQPTISDVKKDYLAKKEKKQANKELNKSIETAIVLDKIADWSAKNFPARFKPQAPLIKIKKKELKRVINLLLSDLHFGADLIGGETGESNYGVHEEARALAHIIQCAVDYKIEHRAETELELLLAGDIIQNKLHDPLDGDRLAAQICRAIHLLSRAIEILAATFSKVRVRCVTGNHGRRTSRHLSRAIFEKWDSEESVIYYALKNEFRRFPNVEFFIPKSPHLVYEVFGRKIMTLHGDTGLKVGNPGRAIQMAALESQINRINASMTDQDEVEVVCSGHVHIPSMTYLSNGTVVITNGPLIPADSFAISLGILESLRGQWIFESTENFAVGDSRLIRVDSKADQDANLEKLISAWGGF